MKKLRDKIKCRRLLRVKVAVKVFRSFVPPSRVSIFKTLVVLRLYDVFFF